MTTLKHNEHGIFPRETNKEKSLLYFALNQTRIWIYYNDKYNLDAQLALQH